MLGEDELRDAILLIFANKQDLPNGKLDGFAPFAIAFRFDNFETNQSKPL